MLRDFLSENDKALNGILNIPNILLMLFFGNDTTDNSTIDN